MKKSVKKRVSLFVLTGLAAATISGASIHTAWSYFTTYAEARGGYTIHLGDETEIKEDFSDWTKHVAIANSDDSQPVYFRAKVLTGERYKDGLTYSVGDLHEGQKEVDGDWTPGEKDYYYFSNPVPAGYSTRELLVHIGNIPEDETDTFNVVVVYESTPVLYDRDGNPYADWNAKVTQGTTEGGLQK